MLNSNSICTVIMSQFNRSSYTDRSVRSLLDNTTQPIDLILIDSGSDFEHVEALRGIAAIATNRLKDIGGGVRTIYLSNNFSIGYNRNIGQAIVRTPYVLHTDNDMLYKPGWLEKAIEYYSSSGADMLSIWSHPHHQKITEIDINTHTRNNSPGNCWFGKKEFFDRWKWYEVPAADFSKHLGEDSELFFRMSNLNHKLYTVNINLLEHFGRIRSDGINAVGF